MATGYEKILAMIQKKNQKVGSEVSSPLTYGNITVNCETTLNPRGFQASGPEGSKEQPISTFLSYEDPAKIKETIELTLNGQLTESVIVPVLPGYQDILGRWVWFCPDLERAEAKTPDLAFASEELIVIIPLLIGNRELASTLVSAKRIFGGTIVDSSLLDLQTVAPYGSQMASEDFQSTERNETLDPAPLGELPGEGRHLVKIGKVLGYLHNFPDYVGPRALLEMKILEGPDADKTLVDNISLPHPQESDGRRKRRLYIECQLGLISKGDVGKTNINWKSLEGVSCLVDVVHQKFRGRLYTMVTNYHTPES